MFNEWDQDKDGKVSNQEMMDVWKKMLGDKFQDNEAQVFFNDPWALPVLIKEPF